MFNKTVVFKKNILKIHTITTSVKHYVNNFEAFNVIFRRPHQPNQRNKNHVYIATKHLTTISQSIRHKKIRAK